MKKKADLLLHKVTLFIEKERLFQRGSRLLIACSGGPDSLTLLDMLARLKKAWDLELTVCYIHHGIRQAADQEVEFVRQEADKRGCRYIWFYTDVPALAKKQHLSIETAGRNERYRLLRLAAAESDAAAIAVAHQQNDQAETVLQHLLRGSGLAGLGGIRPRNGDLVRPLLALTRMDIEEYVQERQLKPCEDETNTSLDYGRNRIRLKLLPHLQEYNPAILADLNRLAEVSRADEDFLETLTETLEQQLTKRTSHSVSIDKAVLLSQPLALQRRLIRRLFARACGGRGNIPFHYTERIRALASMGAGHCFEGSGLCVYTTKEELFFIRARRGAFKKQRSHK